MGLSVSLSMNHLTLTFNTVYDVSNFDNGDLIIALWTNRLHLVWRYYENTHI